jgi:hypothetical protein
VILRHADALQACVRIPRLSREEIFSAGLSHSLSSDDAEEGMILP